MLAGSDMKIGQAGVEGLDDGAVGKAVTKEDGFAVVALWVSGVENESGSGGEGFVRWGSDEVPGSWEPVALHGRHRAEVWLEFSGDELGRVSFGPVMNRDGVAGHRVGFLPVPEGVGVVFNGVLLMKNANRQEGDAQHDEGGDDDLMAADFHVWDLGNLGGYHKLEVDQSSSGYETNEVELFLVSRKALVSRRWLPRSLERRFTF